VSFKVRDDNDDVKAYVT